MSAEALLPGRAREGPPLTVARVLVFRCPECRHQPSVITDVREGRLLLACEECGHTWARDDRRASPERRRSQRPAPRDRREVERRRIFPGQRSTESAGVAMPGAGLDAAATAAAGAGATFGPYIHIRGSVAADEDMLLNGRVEGIVSVPGHTVTIGDAGQIAASVGARNVVVYGSVQGNITATGRIALKAGARVEGDLVSRVLAIAEGAIFTGRVYRPGEAEQRGGATQTT